MAELIECFEYFYGTSHAPVPVGSDGKSFDVPWGAQDAKGEALSRVAASEETISVYNDGWFFGDPQTWLNGNDLNQTGSPNRFNYATTQFAAGTDANLWAWAIGYGVLLIYWLRYKKGFTYPQIVQAGDLTYSALCINLGTTTAAFLADVQANWPAGTPIDFTVLFPNHADNPWKP